MGNSVLNGGIGDIPKKYISRDFQDTDYVLRLFGKKVRAAYNAWRANGRKGISQGEQIAKYRAMKLFGGQKIIILWTYPIVGENNNLCYNFVHWCAFR